MSRNVLIQVKVSLEEKRTIQKLAERHAVYPSQLLRAIGLRAQLGDDRLRAILEEDRAVRMSHAVGEAKAGKPVEEFPVESPGTIDEAMAAEKAELSTADVVAPIVSQAVARDSWIESMTRIHMMEKPGLSKHAARAKATEEYEAPQ